MRLSALLVAVCCSVFAAGFTAFAEEGQEDIYISQSRAIGADRIISSLPEESRKELISIGIDPEDSRSFGTISLNDVFSSVTDIAVKKAASPFQAGTVCLSVILLCSLAGGLDLSVGGRPMSDIASVTGSLCICTVIASPVCSLVIRSAELLKGCSGFMLCYIPVMTSILSFCGSTASAAAYYSSLTTAASVVSVAASEVVVPITNTFLALSLGASVAPGIKLAPLCKTVYKLGVRVLSFAMGIFTAVLSAQTLVSSSLDNVGKKALRFAVSSFVPVVGGALGETLNAFGGSLEHLKTGAGVLVIFASGALVLPLLTECLMWSFSLFLLSSCARLLCLDDVGSSIETAAGVIRMLIALILCMLSLFVISTAAVILAGK